MARKKHKQQDDDAQLLAELSEESEFLDLDDLADLTQDALQEEDALDLMDLADLTQNTLEESAQEDDFAQLEDMMQEAPAQATVEIVQEQEMTIEPLEVEELSDVYTPVVHSLQDLSAAQRRTFLKNSKRKQKRAVRKIAFRRFKTLCAGILLCTALACGATWLHNVVGMPYFVPFSLTQQIVAEVVLLEAPISEAYGTIVYEPEEVEPEEFVQEEWSMILANSDNPLPDDYEENLTVVAPFENSSQTVSAQIEEIIQEMFAAAEEDGIYLYLRSGFRSYATQSTLFYTMVQEYQSGVYTDGVEMSYEDAYAAAKKWRNVPGTSEHETGLAADIVSAYTPNVALTTSLSETAEAIWLKEHCAEFGFILRYPEDKTAITGTSFEPWHFRYVGNPAATEIMESGLCLEEYIELLEGDL